MGVWNFYGQRQFSPHLFLFLFGFQQQQGKNIIRARLLRTIIGSLKRMRTNFVGLFCCLLLDVNLIIDHLPDVITHQICFVHSSEQKIDAFG
jgi:hypothetical protein